VYEGGQWSGALPLPLVSRTVADASDDADRKAGNTASDDADRVHAISESMPSDPASKRFSESVGSSVYRRLTLLLIVITSPVGMLRLTLFPKARQKFRADCEKILTDF
jgi:hypothetical protein